MKWYRGLSDTEKRLYCKSWKLVNEWRTANWRILAFWAKLEDSAKAHADAKEPLFEMTLPSGRTLKYWNPHYEMYMGERKLVAYRTPLPRGKEDLVSLWGGVLTENYIQGGSCDIFCWHCVQLIDAGIPDLYIPFTVHDELIADVPEEHAEETLAVTTKILRTAPPWAKSLPLDCEAKITDRYEK
jgi:DNA polymerase bacteriophage-type